MSKRTQNEKQTLRIMVGMYCRAFHRNAVTAEGKDRLCAECTELIDYCETRIERCPQGEAKTSCRLCPVHCYDRAHRERIKTVMRYAGPRMLFTHPVAAVRHLLREWLRG